MPKRPLTVKEVAALEKPGLHAVGGGRGLYLHISPGGARSWVFRWKRDGRRRDMGLGTAGDKDVTLAKARDLAAEKRDLVRNGKDPIEERRTERQAKRLENARAMTFEQCAKAYIAAHRAGWKSARHAAQWPSTLAIYVYPIIGDLPVQAVDVGLVLKAIEPIWASKPETASRVRGRIEAVLDWAEARGYRQGDNPTRWRGRLENLLPKKTKVRAVEHHAALPYLDLPGFIAELRRQGGVTPRALEFAILTAARTGEVLGARWDEINLPDQVWTIPGARMKAGKEHRVPLSDDALNIIEQMAAIRCGEFIFPGRDRQRLSQTAMLNLLKRMGRNGATTHGFRSSFSDWVAERTAFPSEVREMALAHAVGSKVEEAYRRGDLFDKRRALAEAWARHCAMPADNARVVPIRPAAAGR
jgi:integrase